MTKDSKILRKRLEEKFTDGIGVPTDDYDGEENYSGGFSDRTEDVLAFIEAELALAKKEAYEEVIEFVENSWDKEDLGTYDYKYAKAAIIPNLLKDLRSKFLSESPKEV